MAKFDAMVSGIRPNPRNCGAAAARALTPVTLAGVRVHVRATMVANSNLPLRARAVPQSHGDQMSEEEGDEEDDDGQ